ncbi:GNAT family N-acetyltransferase [Desulfovibrio aminophilus]|uniref:bifunctional acetate--CoA ligase family protein/GNAT family N-acetyltransferase n=1 Tax=Desulfovibrio aminophilus TaxID=81425 RepID=UPI00339A0A53
MGISNLEHMFNPKSVAVIGATNEPQNPGNIVMRNIMTGGFLGPVMPVSNEAEAIAGVLTYPSVQKLPKTPDLAIVCNPLPEVPEILMRLKEFGTKAVVLLAAGYAGMDAEERADVAHTIRTVANPPDVRVLGPKCLGFMVPAVNLYASIAHAKALPGRIAFISQSDSLYTAVLDWAMSQGIGFSHIVSLGSRLDVGFSDILDYLASDPLTRSILLYVESTHDARAFMSAARAASRNKPVVVMRPGLALREVQATLAEANLGSDDVYDVAFRRAGMLRVDSIDGLFDAAQTLAQPKAVRGDRLAILTNGGSAGVQAADALLRGGGRLAELSADTREALDNALGGSWAHSNPVGVPYNAGGKEYSEALKVLVKDPGVDAVLVMHVPFAGLADEEVAQAVAETLKRVKRMVLASWLGSGSAGRARARLSDAGIPTYETPDTAIRAFLYMVEYQKNQELLIETPDSLPSDFFPDTTTAREAVLKALDSGRDGLTEPEAKDVLAAYGIPVVETRLAISAREAVIAADELGYPVAVKLRSPQISQPFDVGGVILDLESAEKVWEACAGILARVSRERPDAYIEGFTVQKMGRRPGAHELFISAAVDPTFGPVIRFGHGGMARELIQDSALAMPPLSMSLARELVSRTRISRLLSGTPDHPVADLDDVCLTLIQVSQLLIDVPQIAELDINPLYADDLGVLALGARIRLTPYAGDGQGRLAIRPYPRELEECVVTKQGRKVTLRPIRPEDEPAHLEFISRLSDEDLRLRFFGVVRRDFGHKDMARFTQIDYDREMAFIATAQDERGRPETLGVVRTSTRPDNSEAEFAIVIRSDLKGSGLGSLLFQKMIRYTASRGTRHIAGQTLVENKAMQGLARKFGFAISPDPHDESMVDMVLELERRPA